MRRGRLSLAAALLAPSLLLGHPAEERGDAEWKRRASGFSDSGRVDPARVGRAVGAYEEALAAEPASAALRFKLIEALYFQGTYATAEREEQEAIFARALELAEEGVQRTEATAVAGRAHFWAALAWGAWGKSHGTLAAARRGVGTKIREHAQLAVSLDPAFRDGGGLRVLGRMHAVAPRIPLVTGWVDRQAGIAFLERACAISRRDPNNPLFLAEALLAHAPERRAEALTLLREVASRRPDPAFVVEETDLLEQAHRRLAELEAPPK